MPKQQSMRDAVESNLYQHYNYAAPLGLDVIIARMFNESPPSKVNPIVDELPAIKDEITPDIVPVAAVGKEDRLEGY